MKLSYYEMCKVVCKKNFLVVFALCFVINIFLVYYLQDTKENADFITYSDEYNRLVNIYGSMAILEAEEKINSELKAFQIFNEMQSFAYAETDDEMQVCEDSLLSYKKEFPKEYKKAEEMNESGSNDTRKYVFLYNILSQIQYIKSYPDFIGEMKMRADYQSSVSVFGDADSFSYKNLYKTADDFAHLKNVELVIGNDKAVVETSHNIITDIFIIGIVFLVCVYLFSFERDKGLLCLVKSSKFGRLKTITSKLIVLFILSFFIVTIFSASNYIEHSAIYGWDNLSRNIQSIQSFRNCIFDITIGKFLLIFIIVKAVGVMVIAEIFAFVFSAFKSSGIMYIVSICIVLAEFLLYNFISPDSIFNYFKYINIFYILDIRKYIGEYLNLNIFSNPVNAFYLVLIIMIAVIFIASVLTSLIFSKRNIVSKNGIFTKVLEKIKRKFLKINGSTSVFLSEIYKFLVVNKMVVFLIILIAYGIYNSNGTVRYSYINPSDAEYKLYMEQLEGDITSDKVDFINNEQEYFDQLNERIDEINSDETISDNAKLALSNSINNIIKTKGEAFERVKAQYERNKDLREPRFIDEIIYDVFVSSDIREWRNLIFFITSLIICLQVVFTIEYKTGMINLIRATKKGKLNLAVKKIIVSFVCMLIVFAALYLPYYIRFISTYGAGSFNTSLRCLYDGSLSVHTILTSVILSQLGYFCIGIFAVSVINFVSVRFKNNLLSMIVSSIILLIPIASVYSVEYMRFGYLIKENKDFMLFIAILAFLLLAVMVMVWGVKHFMGQERGINNVRIKNM